jgi:hypothetical protein
MGRTACTEPQCLYKGALYLTVELYVYSPMGRTACTEPQYLYKGALYLYLYNRAIPLLPLWAVRPVHSLSACTRGHFTFTFTVELYFYSPYGLYALYRALVPVQGCTLPLCFTSKDYDNGK